LEDDPQKVRPFIYIKLGSSLCVLITFVNSIGRSLAIENTIEGLLGITALGGATITGSLVAIGVLSGPSGWAALGAIATAVSVAEGALVIASIIQAKDQQDVSIKFNLTSLDFKRNSSTYLLVCRNSKMLSKSYTVLAPSLCSI
jgi:hypothetical protein